MRSISTMRDHLVGADLVGEGRLERRRQHVAGPTARGVTSRFCSNAASSRSIDADRVDDRVLRRQLEHHRDVAELEVGVDEARPAGRCAARGRRRGWWR